MSILSAMTQPLLDGTHKQVMLIVSRSLTDKDNIVSARAYYTPVDRFTETGSKISELSESEDAIMTRDFCVSGTTEELEDGLERCLQETSDFVQSATNQIEVANEDLKKLIEQKKTQAKPKTRTRTTAKPKPKTKAEKIAEAREEQAKQQKASESLQASLNLDRLSDKPEEKPEDVNDLMKELE
jgi:hypothetical protein